MLEADSCHRLWPTEERRGKGASGHSEQRSRVTLAPRWPSPRTPSLAGGWRSPPPRGRPSPRPGLCNPVAAARPRAGPWGEGRGRLRWGREAATRGAACAGPRAPAAAFPAPGCGGRRGRSGRGVRPGAEPRGKEAPGGGRHGVSGSQGPGEVGGGFILGRGGA